MSTYLVTLDDILKYSRTIDGKERRGVYWETYDHYIVEYPMMNSQGAYSGVTYRTEIEKPVLIEFMMERNPNMSNPDAVRMLKLFERNFLTNFIKVLGEYVQTVKQEPLYLESPPGE